MSSEQTDAAVEEDYRAALEDLNSINRADISTLTTIARENPEYAQGITDALQKHILKAPAHKKLPAIYVLDSIVKNVGTPYTLFLGAQLYETFMEAYAAVDSHVRRKMEETLQTWKQPVPSSLDDRPVFPPDITKPIEDALNRARSSAAALQGRQSQLGRARGMAPNRATPTPPGVRPGSAQPGYPGYPHQLAPPTNGSRPTSAQQAQPPYQPPPPAAQQTGVDVNVLNRDIEELIHISRMELGQNPHDQGVQQRLKGLTDLKMILQTQSVQQDQLILVKSQVSDLAQQVRPHSGQGHHNHAAAPAMAPTPVSHGHPRQQPPTPAAPVAPQQAAPPQQPQVTLASLFGADALSKFQALQPGASSTPHAPTPPQMNGMPIRSPQPPTAEPARQPSAAAPTDPYAVLAKLRDAGILNASTPTATPPVPTPTISAPTSSVPPPGGPVPPPPGIIPANIASLLSSMNSVNIPVSARIMDTIQLDAASLKEFRPHLLPSLYDALGPQCTQCGRRFTKDEEGRKKKTAHMDWHFQVHHRLAEAERRGQHRSWYVDNEDWLKSREAVDADHSRDGAGDGTGPAGSRGGAFGLGHDGGGVGSGRAADTDKSGAEAVKLQYIPVPDASAGVNGTCPICQEKFENKWLDTAQEWVWLDAMIVGNRAYHVSCHSEATQVKEDSPPIKGTPELVLGKRKAEDELKNLRKVKMDAA